MSKAICEKVVDARAMLAYMMKVSPDASTTNVNQILDIYTRHMHSAMDSQVALLAGIAPTIVTEELNKMKEDVVNFSLEILPKHSQAIENYIDETMKVQETLSWRLQRIKPDEFEDIVHPMFKQDEWILLFVGAFLGLVIGLLQAVVLQKLTGPFGCSWMSINCH